ncbi:MAG: long-chain fatty acid--CoA ligase [Aureispira sp.]|nr:long-chain fatty acid--CoA ligase [Aureispira sp.]
MNITKVFELLDYQATTTPLQKAITGKKEDGSSYSYSTEELKIAANQFSTGLLKKGLQKGDKIALISYNNRPEWNIADYGMLQIGVVNVPVYPNISPEEYVYIFKEAEIKYCIVGHGDLLEKVLKAQANLPSLEQIFTFDEPTITKDANDNPIQSWSTLLDSEIDKEELHRVKTNIQEDDLATIIYTSGTTGKPKGVQLTHKNIVSNIKAIAEIMLIKPKSIALSFLPICHGLERTLVYCYMYKGFEVHFAWSIATIGDSLGEVRPHILTAVPRVLEKVYEKIVVKMQKANWLTKTLFFWAENLSKHYDFNTKKGSWYRFKHWIADKLVYSKIRQKLGNRVEAMAVGASACPQKILKFFCAAGIPIREGYGLTETSAVLSVNFLPNKGAMLATVGQVLSGFDVKIDDSYDGYGPNEGEILVKGDSVFGGYHKRPEKTQEAFNDEGWFLTGDIGKIVENEFGYKFIKITDRKKELLKSSNGKYIAPTAIESRLKESFFIAQLMIIGENKKYVAALIVPEFESLKAWAKKKKLDYINNKELLQHPKVQKLYKKIVTKANKHLSHHEQVKKYTLLPNSWSTETNELTPTLKLKRKTIEAKYSAEIGQLYPK